MSSYSSASSMFANILSACKIIALTVFYLLCIVVGITCDLLTASESLVDEAPFHVSASKVVSPSKETPSAPLSIASSVYAVVPVSGIDSSPSCLLDDDDDEFVDDTSFDLDITYASSFPLLVSVSLSDLSSVDVDASFTSMDDSFDLCSSIVTDASRFPSLLSFSLSDLSDIDALESTDDSFDCSRFSSFTSSSLSSLCSDIEIARHAPSMVSFSASELYPDVEASFCDTSIGDMSLVFSSSTSATDPFPSFVAPVLSFSPMEFCSDMDTPPQETSTDATSFDFGSAAFATRSRLPVVFTPSWDLCDFEMPRRVVPSRAKYSFGATLERCPSFM